MFRLNPLRVRSGTDACGLKFIVMIASFRRVIRRDPGSGQIKLREALDDRGQASRCGIRKEGGFARSGRSGGPGTENAKKATEERPWISKWKPSEPLAVREYARCLVARRTPARRIAVYSGLRSHTFLVVLTAYLQPYDGNVNSEICNRISAPGLIFVRP